jgi:hypothetical protein
LALADAKRTPLRAIADAGKISLPLRERAVPRMRQPNFAEYLTWTDDGLLRQVVYEGHPRG